MTLAAKSQVISYPSPSKVYDKVVTQTEIVSTSAENVVYSKSIAAGDMSYGGLLRLTLISDYLNNTISSRALTVRVKFGTTVIFPATMNIPQNVSRYGVFMLLFLANTGATNSQWLGGSIQVGNILGQGDPDEIVCNIPVAGTSAEETSSAKTLYVTIQHSVDDIAVSFRSKLAILELI